MSFPCVEKPDAPDVPVAFISDCGQTLTSTTEIITIDGPAEALPNYYEIWWNDVGPNVPDAQWIDELDPVVLGTLPGGMGPYTNLPSDGRTVWLRLRCLPAGLDPTDPANDNQWIDAQVCSVTSVTN